MRQRAAGARSARRALGDPCQAHRVPVLAVAHELGGDGGLATQGAAQLAHDPLAAPLVEVHVLARERRAPAVGAAVAVGLEHVEAAPEELALELLDVARHLPSTSPRRLQTPSGRLFYRFGLAGSIAGIRETPGERAFSTRVGEIRACGILPV